MNDKIDKDVVKGLITLVGPATSTHQRLILGGVLAHLSAMSIVNSPISPGKFSKVEELSAAKADRDVPAPYVKLERAGSSKHNYSADRRRAKKNRRSK